MVKWRSRQASPAGDGRMDRWMNSASRSGNRSGTAHPVLARFQEQEVSARRLTEREILGAGGEDLERPGLPSLASARSNTPMPAWT